MICYAFPIPIALFIKMCNQVLLGVKCFSLLPIFRLIDKLMNFFFVFYTEEYVSDNKRLKGIGICSPDGPLSLDDFRSLQRSNTVYYEFITLVIETSKSIYYKLSDHFRILNAVTRRN